MIILFFVGNFLCFNFFIFYFFVLYLTAKIYLHALKNAVFEIKNQIKSKK